MTFVYITFAVDQTFCIHHSRSIVCIFCANSVSTFAFTCSLLNRRHLNSGAHLVIETANIRRDTYFQDTSFDFNIV